jgi:hypothetical protein
MISKKLKIKGSRKRSRKHRHGKRGGGVTASRPVTRAPSPSPEGEYTVLDKEGDVMYENYDVLNKDRHHLNQEYIEKPEFPRAWQKLVDRAVVNFNILMDLNPENDEQTEMIQSEGIKEINKLGLITIAGQSGECKAPNGQNQQTYRQRSYVRGVIYRKTGEWLINRITMHTDMIAHEVVVYEDGPDDIPLPKIPFTSNILHKRKQYNYNSGANLKIFISFDEMKKNLTEKCESYDLDFTPLGISDTQLMNDYMVIEIFDPHWGRSGDSYENGNVGLFVDIRECMQNKPLPIFCSR